MTRISPDTAPALHTDDDVDRRVADLVGRATRDDTLWLLLVDGDDRQSPVLVPIDDLPRQPDPRLLGGLGEVLEGVLPDLATAGGAGSVVFVRERLGPDGALPADRSWAEALTSMCRDRGIRVRGVHLSTRRRTQRLS